MSTMADTWDDQHPRVTRVASGSMGVNKPKLSKHTVVPDNWDVDEEEEEEEEEEEGDIGPSVDLHNKQLWEDVNSKVHHPMPSLIISRGTSSTSVALPSLPLNQPPPMRILKRPPPSSSHTASTNSSTATGETLKEREARYHAARERIFGASPNEELVEDNEDKKKTPKKVVSPPVSPHPAASVKLVREPRGPDANAFDTQGFGERKAKRPPSNNDIPTD